jgi:hypothetical protein
VRCESAARYLGQTTSAAGHGDVQAGCDGLSELEPWQERVTAVGTRNRESKLVSVWYSISARVALADHILGDKAPTFSGTHAKNGRRAEREAKMQHSPAYTRRKASHSHYEHSGDVNNTIGS